MGKGVGGHLCLLETLVQAGRGDEQGLAPLRTREDASQPLARAGPVFRNGRLQLRWIIAGRRPFQTIAPRQQLVEGQQRRAQCEEAGGNEVAIECLAAHSWLLIPYSFFGPLRSAFRHVTASLRVPGLSPPAAGPPPAASGPNLVRSRRWPPPAPERCPRPRLAGPDGPPKSFRRPRGAPRLRSRRRLSLGAAFGGSALAR